MILKRKLKASSLVESIIAISIISACLLVGLQVFNSVLTTTSLPSFYQSQARANKLLGSLLQESSEKEKNNTLDSLEKEQITFQNDLPLLEVWIPYLQGQELTLWILKPLNP